MWKLEFDEYYYRIYDSKNQIAGYFDPEYGDIFPKENEEEIIEKMHKTHEKIPGGYLMFPLVKFGIFDSGFHSTLQELIPRMSAIVTRLQMWEEFLSLIQTENHYVRISHTDQDMLSITIPMRFSKPTPLHHKDILIEISPILNQLHQQSLL